MKTIYLLEGSIGQWEDTFTWHVCAYEDKVLADAARDAREKIVQTVYQEERAFVEQNPEPDLFTNIEDGTHEEWLKKLIEIRRALPDQEICENRVYEVPSYHVAEVTLLNETDQ